MKNIFLIIVLSILPLSMWFVFYRAFDEIVTYWSAAWVSPEEYGYIVAVYFSELIFCLCVIALCIFAIVCILRKTNFTNFVRYTYEEYRERREKKKAEKLNAKKQKIQIRLNEIEKDTE